MIFELEPQDGIAAYVELLDPHVQCDALRLFVGWLGLLLSSSCSLSLSLPQRELSLQEGERQLALSLCFLTKKTEIKREGAPSLSKRQKERASSRLKEAASS